MVAPAPEKSPRKEASLPAPLAEFYSQPKPHWLVEESLSANRWTIQLEDPTLRRNALISIPFDVFIAPGMSLLDKTQWRDLLTTKLYIYLALTGRNSFIRTSTSSRTLKPALDRLLNSFAGMVGMPPLPDGSQWSFTPHQLRRFFAITYYYRFRDRSLTALSHYLRHNNPDSTRTYITEAKMGGLLKMVDQAKADMERARRAHRSEQTRQREFEEVGLDFRVEIFQGALAGTETLAGWAGARMFDELKRLRNEWDRRLEVGDFGADAPTLDDLITEFARSQVLEPNGQGHSYCACTASEKDTSVAACALEGRQREGIGSTRLGPDLRFAADLIQPSRQRATSASVAAVRHERKLVRYQRSDAGRQGARLARSIG